MKYKVADLVGYRLDLLVSECEGGIPEHYSTDWSCGGPIIERERIRLDCPWGDMWAARHEFLAKRDGCTPWIPGPTPLIAAMRCYVMSKLGEEVEIPESI